MILASERKLGLGWPGCPVRFLHQSSGTEDGAPMDSRTINDLSLAFGRQEIALWLGPDWTPDRKSTRLNSSH